MTLLVTMHACWPVWLHLKRNHIWSAAYKVTSACCHSNKLLFCLDTGVPRHRNSVVHTYTFNVCVQYFQCIVKQWLHMLQLSFIYVIGALVTCHTIMQFASYGTTNGSDQCVQRYNWKDDICYGHLEKLYTPLGSHQMLTHRYQYLWSLNAVNTCVYFNPRLYFHVGPLFATL